MRASSTNKRVTETKGTKVNSNLQKRKDASGSLSERGRSTTPIEVKRTRNKNIGKHSLSSEQHSKCVKHPQTRSDGQHHHHSHPTRCLRGVSTRATYKRSPSPRKDWPFDEALLYPPHPRERLHALSTESPVINRYRAKMSPVRTNKNTSSSPLRSTSLRQCSPSLTRQHSPHPTRCLRGVSTRATYKRSPSPRKDWPFDEALLYPTHLRECLSKDATKKTTRRKLNAAERNVTSLKDGGNENMKMSFPNVNAKKLGGDIKSVHKKPRKKVKSPVSRSKKRLGKSTMNGEPRLPIVDKKFRKEDYFDVESVATVLDGEESFELSPVTELHVGWGGNTLRNYWANKISGKNLKTEISSALLWIENHRGAVAWRPHKCINDYRLVSNSKIHFNPYGNSSIVQIGEYIWQLSLNGEKKLNSNYPPLFELLFVKKDSLLSSIFNRFCSNPSSYDSVFKELMTQSLFGFHRNILRVNEVLESESLPYTTFVMEYLPHSCMIWDEKTKTYFAPSIKSNRRLNRVYTSCGARLVFLQILEAYKYLHNMNISGIYIRPESVRMSHSLDETYFDKYGNTLTRLVLSDGKHLLGGSGGRMGKINLSDEIARYWRNSEQINISDENSAESVERIHEMIQSNKRRGTPHIRSRGEMYLFEPEHILNGDTLFDCNSFTNAEKEANDDFHVKLNYIFRGKSTNSRESFFTGK